VADLLLTCAYPEDCRATIELADVDDGLPAMIAYGFVTPEDAKLTAEVRQAGTRLADGTFLSSPSAPFDWQCWFAAPTGGFPTDQLLKMFIHATKGGQTVAAVRHIIFSEPGGSFGPTITISYPPPPSPGTAHVPATFTAYGLVNPTTATMSSGVLSPSPPGNLILGNSVAPPAGFNWAYQFTNVPNGSYTLIVSAMSGGQTSYGQDPIIVP
jgi:hypothetical protein